MLNPEYADLQTINGRIPLLPSMTETKPTNVILYNYQTLDDFFQKRVPGTNLKIPLYSGPTKKNHYLVT